MNKGLILVLVIGVLAAAGFFAFATSNDDSTSAGDGTAETTLIPDSSTNSASNDASSEPADTDMYTEAEVASHNTEDDCWTIIDGSVYDITSYIPRHPGGAEILRACGADGSTLFNTRTTEDGETVGSGTGHSTNARGQLAGFKVGDVATE